LVVADLRTATSFDVTAARIDGKFAPQLNNKIQDKSRCMDPGGLKSYESYGSGTLVFFSFLVTSMPSSSSSTSTSFSVMTVGLRLHFPLQNKTDSNQHKQHFHIATKHPRRVEPKANKNPKAPLKANLHLKRVNKNRDFPERESVHPGLVSVGRKRQSMLGKSATASSENGIWPGE